MGLPKMLIVSDVRIQETSIIGSCNSLVSVPAEVSNCSITESLEEGAVFEPRIKPSECIPFVVNFIETTMDKLLFEGNDAIPKSGA